jgi:signal transduction histidine kinase
MHMMATTPPTQNRVDQRADTMRHDLELALWKQTDRLFAALLAFQWAAGVAMAVWISPWAWEGLSRHLHPHIWAAVYLGGLIAAVPIYLALTHPGETLTRFVIAAAQMLHSAMLIHLSGGRIETHFHVFGSLAFLSFYRDWRVLIPATLVVAVDHMVRGIFWPQSVFGVATASNWRWIEHAAWVIFEDIFLVWACIRGAHELATLARRQAELELSNEQVEIEVARQTSRLESVSQELLNTARRAGMAEIATGVLHNVGNVLNTVNVSNSVIGKRIKNSEISSLMQAGDLLKTNQNNLIAFLTADDRGKHLVPFLIELSECLGREQQELLAEVQTMEEGLDHVKQIVSAQQRHAKDGTMRAKVVPAELFEQAIGMDLGSTSDQQVKIVRNMQDIEAAALDKHKVLQILINLLSNAKKAALASGRTDKQVTVSTRTIAGEQGEPRLVFEVMDNGIGIDPENLTRIFSHGFTTYAEGHGFGLHSAANAAREMGGNLSVASEGPGRGATFTLDLPLVGLSAAEELMTQKRVRHAVK